MYHVPRLRLDTSQGIIRGRGTMAKRPYLMPLCLVLSNLTYHKGVFILLYYIVKLGNKAAVLLHQGIRPVRRYPQYRRQGGRKGHEAFDEKSIRDPHDG
jgi:hypothetical protein